METSEATKDANPINRGRKGHRISILDLILRIFAAIGTLGSAVAMGTTNQTLPFSLQFVQFRAQYNDLPTFTFFVIVNSIVFAYVVFSLPLSVFHIIKKSVKRMRRIILLILDTVMLVVLRSGASAAASVVYLSQKGNANANWAAICPQFSNFCHRISASLLGSFFSILIFMFITFTSLFFL